MYQMFLGSQKIQLPKLLPTRKKKTSETAQDLGDYKTSIRTLSFLLTPFNLRHRIQFKVKKWEAINQATLPRKTWQFHITKINKVNM